MTVSFFQRPYPSANAVLLHGYRPVLVDPGFGADVPALLHWLHGQGVAPDALSLVLNTHWHADHAGGNHVLQREHGRRIAAEAGEAAAVNQREADACRARWLHQPIESYDVARPLRDGDQVATGTMVFRVVASPGHTPGHICLHSAEQGVLILGDAFHGGDVGWLDTFAMGPDALAIATESVERLARLPARIGYSGHGPGITDLPGAVERVRGRLRAWQQNPQRIGWHACKRIFAHALMLSGGVAEDGLSPMLLACPWFRDHATHVFGLSPDAFVPLLLEEMLRSGAALWHGERLVAGAPYTPVPHGWPHSPATPVLWPPRA